VRNSAAIIWFKTQLLNSEVFLPHATLNKLLNVSTLHEKPEETHGPANITWNLTWTFWPVTEHGKRPKSASADVFLPLARAL